MTTNVRLSGQAVNATSFVPMTPPYAIADLMEETWLSRLLAAFKEAGISERAAGQRAGLGSSFVSDVKNAGKEPKLANVLALCEVAGVSPVYILTGIRARPEDEAFLRAFVALSPDQRNSVAKMVKAFLPPKPSEK